ncbi:MAG: hypothetical protein FH761_08490 [Firmicutes bacterium]|nr:hypothetical protein [Bacillota bacterium]
MKKIMRKAHNMTRELVEKYGVDYKTQLGLCLAYLLNNEESVKEMKTNTKKELTLEMIDNKIKEYDKLIQKALNHEGRERENGLHELANTIISQRADVYDKRCKLYEIRENIENYNKKYFLTQQQYEKWMEIEYIK